MSCVTTRDTFRDEIETILDRIMPDLLRPEQLVTLAASSITDDHDWWPLAERLAACVGQPLLAPGVDRPRRPRAPASRTRPGVASDASGPQLDLQLPDGS